MSLALRETKGDNRIVWAICAKTGLRFATVRNLLVNGWTYKEGIDQTPVWVHPMSRLEEVK